MDSDVYAGFVLRLSPKGGRPAESPGEAIPITAKGSLSSYLRKSSLMEQGFEVENAAYNIEEALEKVEKKD